MDISRRSFLKLSLGGLLAAAVNTNPVLSAISNAVSESPYQVFLYLIQTKEGKWKVKGTTCTNVEKVQISPVKFNTNTFKPLGVYSAEEANDKKLEFWNQYNCGSGFQKVDYQLRINNGNKAKNTGQLNSVCKKGAQSRLKYVNQLNKERNHWEKLRLNKIGKARSEETKKKLYETSKHSWRVILQYDKNGKLIKEWENLAIIEKETGMAKSNIGNCCRGTNGVRNVKSAYGFIWKYKEGDV